MCKMIQKVCFICMVIFVLGGCAARQVPMPTLDGASDWENYLTLTDRYYYLDPARFNEISCDIDVSSITKSVETVKSQLANVKNNVIIKDNSSNFSLTYNPKSGLRFSEPQFQVILRSKKGLPDPERAEDGIEMINAGFKQQVKGTKDVIRSVFESYQRPIKNQRRNIVVEKENGSILVKYNFKDNYFIEKHYGNTIHVFQNLHNINVTATQKYSKTPTDKLILEKAIVLLKQPDTEMKMNVSIKYQNIGKLILPIKIEVASEMVFYKMVQKGEFEIYFLQWKVR